MQFTATMNPNGVVIDGGHSLSTLLIVNDKEKSATRGSILTALAAKGVDPKRIAAIAPTRQFNHWIVVAKEQETFERILEAGITQVSSRPAEVTTYSSNVLFGRIFYLPPQLGDEAPVEFLEKFGTIRKFWRETSTEETCEHLETGVRSFVMEPHSTAMTDEIPQTACLGGTEVLIRIRGQQPRCFGCNSAGHQRRECTQRQPPPAKKPVLQKGISGAKVPVPATPAAASTPRPASPKKPQPRPQSPPAKAVTRHEEREKRLRAPTPCLDDSEDESTEEQLIQKALELLPGTLQSWGEKFFSRFTDQSRAKFLRIRCKMTQDADDAIRMWLSYHERKHHESLRAARS